MKFGVQVPIAERVVAELGEEAAWDLARSMADRRVARTGWEGAPRSEESLPQNVSRSDPDSGTALEPVRLYRFLYTLGGAA